MAYAKPEIIAVANALAVIQGNKYPVSCWSAQATCIAVPPVRMKPTNKAAPLARKTRAFQLVLARGSKEIQPKRVE